MQSRYYDPAIGRFINADSLVSTGQGFLGHNMFAYCRNNPVNRKDAVGMDDVSVTDEDDNIFNDMGGGVFRGNGCRASGGGIDWDSFIRTLQGALDGLSMAMGNRNLTHTEQHHLFSDKHKTYTPQYKEVTDRYNYSLDHSSNIVPLEGHSGRHTNAYHNFMVFGLHELDAIAANDPAIFIEGMYIIGQFVQDNSWLPYAKYK